MRITPIAFPNRWYRVGLLIDTYANKNVQLQNPDSKQVQYFLKKMVEAKEGRIIPRVAAGIAKVMPCVTADL